MTWLAAVALPALLLLVGGYLLPRLEGEGAPGRVVSSSVAGLVLLGLLLSAFEWTGIPWHPLGILGGLWLAGLAGRRLVGETGLAQWARWPSDLDWGDGVALAGFLAFASMAPTLWITNPDFVYHWGIKGERFLLARGIDWEFLVQPWNAPLHPDYPHLLPSLYASTGLLAGRFHAPSLMLWSVLFAALILLGAREVWRTSGVDRSSRQTAIAFLSLALAACATGALLAGGADLIIALALVAALPALLGLAGDGPAAGLRLGMAAALAAGSKIEGVPLAAFLVGAFLLGSWRRTRRLDLRLAAAAALPPLLTAVPWLAGVWRHGLFQEANSAPFDWSRAEALLPAMAETASAPELHGLPWLVLLLPVLLAWPGARGRLVRPFALAASAQLLFYFWVYFASTLEPRSYVVASFARLLLHLLPATVIAVVVAAGAAHRPIVAAGGAAADGIAAARRRETG